MSTPAHLHSVDMVRVLTVGLVIGVHTVSQQPGGTGLTSGALLIVMHVSREVFFLLTAFVLGYSYRDRAPKRWPAFWRRRYLLIGVPYLVWSAMYFLALGHGWQPAAFAEAVLTGTAQYHLYFLLVSMQLYLVFPVLRWALRATAGRHGWLLAAAVGYQIAVYAVVQRWPGDPNPLLASYLGFVVAGGVAASHTETFFGWTRRHLRQVFLGAAIVVAAGVGWFFAQVEWLGRTTVAASEVFQPVVVVESFAVAWTFLALGLAWQDRGMPGRRRIRAASDASFGVYLAHPLVLQGLFSLSAATGLTAVAARLSGAVVTAVVLVVAVPLIYLTCVAAVASLRRTPLSLPLTGHARRRRTGGPSLVPVSPGGLQCERQAA
ncbi:MAG TPA: acyltransferase [Planosporangium sp.]|nr:acyltransferase [Planosporangium sp.]